MYAPRAGVRRPRCRGHSLLEVLVASALLALLLGVGLPRLPALLVPHQVAAAAEQIAADIALARMRAIARNVRFRVHFDVAAGTWVLQRESSPGVFVDEGGTRSLPAGTTLVSVVPGDPVFDGRGLASGATVISIAGPQGETRTVVTNMLGRARIS